MFDTCEPTLRKLSFLEDETDPAKEFCLKQKNAHICI